VADEKRRTSCVGSDRVSEPAGSDHCTPLPPHRGPPGSTAPLPAPCSRRRRSGGWGCLNVTCIQCKNGKSVSTINSAQPTMAHHPRMTRIQTRISHVHPTASIHQRGMLLRLCVCGVLRASAPPAMLSSGSSPQKDILRYPHLS
jgi:hypothetical protein